MSNGSLPHCREQAVLGRFSQVPQGTGCWPSHRRPMPAWADSAGPSAFALRAWQSTARGNHSVVDCVPPLSGPNEERNPLDLALGAHATCGTFLYEAAAKEMDMPLTDVAATVEVKRLWPTAGRRRWVRCCSGLPAQTSSHF